MSTPAEQRERELARPARAMPESAFTAKVVGVTFVDSYPDNLYALDGAAVDAEEMGEQLTAVPIRNPDNAYDSNAIEVHVPALGEDWAMIGHLASPIARRLAPAMDAGQRWDARIESVLIDRHHLDRPGVSIYCAPVREEHA